MISRFTFAFVVMTPICLVLLKSINGRWVIFNNRIHPLFLKVYYTLRGAPIPTKQ